MSTIPTRMRGFRKVSRRADDVAVLDLDVPAPGPDEVLVEVAGCGVCGSDLHAVHADRGYESMAIPVTLGHELAGRVVAAGAGTAAAVGDLVVAVSIQGCGGCVRCQGGRSQLCADRRILGIHTDGGLAGYVRVASRHLVPVPDGLDPVEAALAEPLSVAVHAVLERTSITPGARVVVTGPGPIGLLAARLAHVAGAEVLVLGAAADAPLRLPFAERLGVATANLSDVSAAEAIRSRFGAAPPDTWLEASGAVPAFGAAVAEIGPGGQLTVIAQYASPVELFVPDLLRRDVTLAFSYAANAAAYDTALRLLATGVVPTAGFQTRYALDDAATALADVAAGRVVKATVVP